MLRQGSGIVTWFLSSHGFPVGGLVPPRKQPVPPVAHRSDRRLWFRWRHHLLKQLSDEGDGIDLVVVAAGREAEELGAEVGEPRLAVADTSRSIVSRLSYSSGGRAIRLGCVSAT
jgi:hypothetical protein